MVKKKIKLLIVDDEKDICNFVKLLLRKKGFLVYSALSGSKAIMMAKKLKPQIALLDIYLKKGINGLGVLRQIRELIPECRCVIVTWDKAQAKMREAKNLGAVSYLTKPLTINELYKVINRIVKDIRKGGKTYG